MLQQLVTLTKKKNSLYYFYSFSLSLKLNKNKQLLEKGKKVMLQQQKKTSAVKTRLKGMLRVETLTMRSKV